MTTWSEPLPPTVATGDPDHAGIHNKTTAAINEIRSKFDGLDAASLNADVAGAAASAETAAKAYTDTKVAGVTPSSIGALPVSGGTVTGRLSNPVAPYGIIAATRSNPDWRKPSTSFQFQTGHGWTSNGALSTNLNNTSAFVRGSQCASMTTNVAQEQANLLKTGMASMDLTGKAFRLICRISDVSKIKDLNVFVGSSNFANYFRWRLWEVAGTSQLGSNNEWITLTFGWSSVNAGAGTFSIGTNGTPSSTTGFTDIQIQAVSVTGQSVTVDVQALEIISSTSTTYPNGVISIVFDDGDASVYSMAKPAMDTYGFRGTNYVIAEALGTPGCMTVAQNKVLQDFCGWEIGLHAYATNTHNSRYTTLTAAQADDDLRRGKEWLVYNGFRGESMAYPGGEYQSTTDNVGIDTIAARYFTTARTIIFQTGFPTETFPAGNPYRLRAVSSISSMLTGQNNPTNIAAAGGLLDKIKNNSGHLILVFHKITAGAPTVATECSLTDFQALMAAINTSGIPVVPVGDVYRTNK